MRYAHVTNNWDLSNGNEKYGVSYHYHEAVRCNKYHFMDNSTDNILHYGHGNTFNDQIFDGWEGYSIMCLDYDWLKNLDGVILSGSEVSMYSQSLNFEVNRCSNDSYPIGTPEDKMCHS